MKVLLIAEYVPPAASIGAVRWTKLGKYLSLNHDCQIDILTNKKSYTPDAKGADFYKRDTALLSDLSYFGQVFELPGTFLSRKMIDLANRLISHRENKAQLVTQKKVTKEANDQRRKNNSFAERLSKIYVNFKNKAYVTSSSKVGIKWSSYDVIISTYWPKWTHLVAEHVKSENPNLIWLADYRDPLTGYISRMTKDNLSFARNHTVMADCVTVVSEGVVEHLHLPSQQLVKVIHNGYDQDDLRQRSRIFSDKFTLSYTGTLYNEPPNVRDMTPVFEALTELIESGKVDSDDIEIAYCGISSDEFLLQASAYPLVPIVDYGLIKSQEARELQDRSSVLIFCTWNTEYSKGALTGKLYEYLSSGVPIAAICSGNISDHESSDIIMRTSTGFAYEQANRKRDFAKLCLFIEDMYRQWKEHGVTTVNQKWHEIEKFSHRNLADEVYDLIDSLRQSRVKFDEKSSA